MMNIKLLASLVLLITLGHSSDCSSFDRTDDEIQSIALITRHGDRYPCKKYPNDPYEKLFNEKSYGSLTTAGRMHMYSMGRNLRSKFPRLARRRVTKLRSSIVPRCIESLQLLVAGLNGPSESLPPPPDVLSIPKVDDPMLNHGSVQCPARKVAILSDRKFQNLSLEYSSLWLNVSKVTTVANLSVDDFINDRIEPIMSEFLMKLPMPTWATPEIYFSAKDIIDKSIWLTSQLPVEGKLSGVFYSDLINQLKSSQNSTDASFFGYATHDTTLGPIMYNIGLWPGHRPFYGEGLLFVLKVNGSLSVYFYDEKHHLHPQILPGCTPKSCTIEKFEKSIGHLVPRNWRVECASDNSI